MYRNALFRRVTRDQLEAERKQRQETPLPSPRISFGEAAARYVARLTIADALEGDSHIQDVPTQPHMNDKRTAALWAQYKKEQQELNDRRIAECMNEWMDDWETEPPKNLQVQIAEMEDNAYPHGMSGGPPCIISYSNFATPTDGCAILNNFGTTPNNLPTIPPAPPTSPPASSRKRNPSSDHSPFPVGKPRLGPINDREAAFLADLAKRSETERAEQEEWEANGGEAVLGEFWMWQERKQWRRDEEKWEDRAKRQREENLRVLKEKMAVARREKAERERERR
jgi:hypothetical protein